MSTTKAIDLQKHIREGWRVRDFIDSLAPEVERIMSGRSWRKPFTSKQELAAWCRDNQPYYKKRIPGVNNYFARLDRKSTRLNSSHSRAFRMPSSA